MRQPLSDGTLIQNRYRILRMLGQGGFGRTYLAQDTHRFNEPCVLKEFDPQTQGSKHAQKAEELFAREAGTLYKLHHPQIPQFREMFRVTIASHELLFLVQDYVGGKTYYELLEERRNRGLAFSETEVTNLLLEILPVLDYIHRAGIIHRDISPDNIMLRDRDQKPVLIDFGVVKSAATQIQQPSSATFVGKPGYAPIEQLQKGKAEPSSDLYALAVTVAVLLTGREPQTLFDPMNLTWQWNRYAKVSPVMSRVLERMLGARPSDRYASATDVLEVLNANRGVQVQVTSPVSTQVGSPTTVPATSSPVTHQKTLALGRRPKNATLAATSAADPRPWTDAIFDVPYLVLKGTFSIIKGMFKMVFGVVKFAVMGTFSLVAWMMLGAVAIATLIWATPRLIGSVPMPKLELPSLPKIEMPSLPKIEMPSFPTKPSTTTEEKRGQSLQDRSREVGMDFDELIQQTNEKFYQRYPSRRGRPLSSDRADQPLRDEWHRMAQEILNQRAGERKTQRKVAEY
jgi:serine/threonine protein kinase